MPPLAHTNMCMGTDVAQCRFAKEQDMLTTLAYSASLPAITISLIVIVATTYGLVF
jgi:hypothetical protein